MSKEHAVEKTIRQSDIKVVLSDHMKSLGYKACQGHGGAIGMTFKRGKDNYSFDEVIFEVQDSLNPEPERMYLSKKEALECIAEAKGIDLNKVDISIT